MTINRKSSSPDGGYGWVIVACSAFCMCSVLGISRIAGLVIIEIMDLYDINRTEAFLVLVLRRLFSFALAPIIGKLYTKFDNNVILCSGCLVFSLSLILTSFTTTYWQFLITYGVIQGLSHNCILSGSSITVGLYFKKRRSLAIGVLYAIAGSSGFVSPLLFNWLLETYYFNGAILILGGLTLHSATFGMLVEKPPWMRDKEKSQMEEEGRELLKLPARDSDKVLEHPSKFVVNYNNERADVALLSAKNELSNVEDKDEIKVFCIPIKPERETKPSSSFVTGIFKEIRQDLRLFKDGLFLLQLFNKCCIILTVYFLTMLPDFVEGEIMPGITKQQVAFVLSVTAIGDVVCRFLIGSILDKLPWAKKHSLGGISVFLGITIIAFQFTQSYLQLLVASVFFGLWSGMKIVVQRLVEIELMGPKRIHMANGISRFVVGFVNVTAGLLIGFLRDELGSYKVCLNLLGGSAILGGLVWFAEPLIVKCFPPESPDWTETIENNKIEDGS